MTSPGILTTHAGSLPRPLELADLLVRKSRGEEVNLVKLEKLGVEAVRWVVEKQRAAGIQVCGNGEQQRSSFFLYLKDRLSGLGSSWTRGGGLNIDYVRYPEFEEMAKKWEENRAVSHRTGLPKVIGPISYQSKDAAHSEARRFPAHSGRTGRWLRGRIPHRAVARFASRYDEERILRR